MSESHKLDLPIIRRHVQQMGWGDAHIEVQLARGGERCDVWARAEVPINEALQGVTSEVDLNLWAGMTSVHDLKDGVADLRADADKPWRRRDRRALGDHRFIWLRADGRVRPEQVDEERHFGWGVVVFNETTYDVVRPSRRFACAFYDTINLVHELRKKEMYQALERQRENLLTAMPVAGNSIATPAPNAKPARPANALLDMVDAFLDDGYATTGMIIKHLREEHGIKTTPGKLAADMRMSKRYLAPSAAGGSWCRVNPEPEEVAS